MHDDGQIAKELESRWAEFAPGETEAALASFDRRTFLKLMGASLALAGSGLAGCAGPQPAEKIVPTTATPEGALPGIPRFYASSLPTGAGAAGGAGGGWVSGFGRGIIVEQHEGRPTKIEGNPDHPSSLGATDIFMQAAVLQLYDPDRSKNCFRGENKQSLSWGGVLNDLRRFIADKGGAKALRVRLLTGTLTSPTLIAQIEKLRAIFPKLACHIYDVINTAPTREAQRQALGRFVTPLYDFSKATRIVSLDAHFLADDPGSLRYAREFAHRRRVPFGDIAPDITHLSAAIQTSRPDADSMSRLYVAESTLTYTGAMADHRLAIKPSLMPTLVRALAESVLPNTNQQTAPSLPPEIKAWVAATAADLKSHAKESLVLAGAHLPAELQALAYAMNHALGNIGTTIRYIDPIEVPADSPDHDPSLRALNDAMIAGDVDLLLIIEANPAFTAPTDVPFAETLRRFSVPPGTARNRLALHAGGYLDETATLCNLHIPLSHPFEAWGDLRAHDGTAGIVQPLIEPLYQTKSAIEILAALAALGTESAATQPTTSPTNASAADLFASGYDHVRNYWLSRWSDLSPADREMRWRKSLRDGIIENTASPAITINATPEFAKLLTAATALEKPPTNAIELSFRPDPTTADGSWANHPWLRELPKPLTRLTWENAALVGPETAKRLGFDIADHDARKTVQGLRITANGHTIDIPAWIQPGHPEETITLHVGSGRRADGIIQQADGSGVNIYPLRNSDSWSATENIRVEKIDREFKLACTQPVQSQQGRDIARMRRVADLPKPDAPSQSPDLYSTEADPQNPGKKIHLSLYEENPYPGYKWGMVIDLSACIGCQACVIACQAENNIPIVGKEQVYRGREMHWLRIDTYLTQNSEPRTQNYVFQPMLCQHCENAPCEVVCPVEATTHSSEGLNEMTYNRCVGTRDCSNNCPYKVRRFNFYQYNSHNQLTLNMQRNPNVTVRSRGVMEKCTYCVQRLNRARIEGKKAWAKSATDPLAPPTEMRTPAPADDFAAPELLPRLRPQTACQQSCPTQAILFGDLNDSASLVARLKKSQAHAALDYGVLTELNTQPRTSYLERLTNPNPALAPVEGAT